MPSILSLVTGFKREFDPKIHSTRLYEAFAEIAKQLSGLTSGNTSAKMYARVTASAGLTIPTGVVTALAFDIIRVQEGLLHSTTTQNTRFTAPISGFYKIGASIQWPAALVGIRQLQIMLNGVTVIASRVDFAQAVAAIQDQIITGAYYLNPGDYLEIVVYQNSGGPLVIPVTANYSPEVFIYQ